MQKIVRDNLGYIDLDEMGCEYQAGTFFIEGEKYYYKDSRIGAFKELVIDELAQDAGIVCAYYDLASFSDRAGLISRDLNSNGNRFVEMYDLLSEFYQTRDYRTLKNFNNLDDIGIMLEQLFDHETFQRLITQLDDILLFDILTGNPDRNVSNYGLLYYDGSYQDRTVDVAIFDNELGLDADVYYEDKFLLKRKRNSDDLSDISWDRVQIGLDLISEEHINEVLERVEEKIGSTINSEIKSRFITFFKRSRELICQKIPKQDVKQV